MILLGDVLPAAVLELAELIRINHGLRLERSATVSHSRHFFQQPAKAFHGLSYMQPFFYRPQPRRDRMNHRHLEILFQQMNDIEAAPTRAEHVDTVRAWIL